MKLGSMFNCIQQAAGSKGTDSAEDFPSERTDIVSRRRERSWVGWGMIRMTTQSIRTLSHTHIFDLHGTK